MLFASLFAFLCIVSLGENPEIMHMAIDYAKKIGFTGQFLFEPKPKEPTKHQYDFDAAACINFIRANGLEDHIKPNLETNHATLAGHSMEHELEYAGSQGFLGSMDANTGDLLLGWDTDQFPNNVPEMALAYYQVLQAGGFTTGGTNFDAKLRRQSLDPQDLLIGHIGGMDCCARGLKAAAKMIEDGALSKPLKDRYSKWEEPEAQKMLRGELKLDEIAALVEREDINPEPKSGRQEYLENVVNRYV